MSTKIGDIFSVDLENGHKKYFQLIAFDLAQLNSDVIRAFSEEYPVNENVSLNTIINSNIEFYAHCVTKLGLKMKLWEKVGNNSNIGNFENIYFRDTNDYGSKVGEEGVKATKNWYIWRINDKDFTSIKTTSDELRNSHIGLVINPLGIIEMLKGNKYPINYPDFV